MTLASDKFEPHDVKRKPIFVSERDLRVLSLRLTGTETVDGLSCGAYLSLEVARLNMSFNMDAMDAVQDAKILRALSEHEKKDIAEPFVWPFRLDDPLNPLNRK
jgi:hypothetical protein